MPWRFTYRHQVTRDEFIARNRPPLSIAVNLKQKWGTGERGQHQGDFGMQNKAAL